MVRLVSVAMPRAYLYLGLLVVLALAALIGGLMQ